MKKRTDEHYLKQELDDLMRRDASVFEFLQSGSLDGIWYWDLEQSENEYMSPRFWETLGYDPLEREHVAAEWQELIDPGDLEVALKNFHAHCDDPDHPYDQIVRYRHRDGSTVWIRCRGLVIRDEAGKPIRMLGAHSDVTSLKEAEQLIVSILEAAPYALFAADTEGIVKLSNPEAEKLFGAKPGGLSGVSIKELFSSPRDSRLPRIMAKGIELQAHRLDGEAFPAEVSSRPIDAHHDLSMLYAVLDLTERKAKEAEIKAAREEAENANHAKSLFLANMSHELRTPLNAIIGYAELLETSIERLGHKDLARDAERIRASGLNLLTMISEVLDISKIEAGRMDLYLEEFSLQVFVDDVTYVIAGAIEKNRNTFELDVEADLGMIRTDQTRLRQILLNLLSNAAKFTEDGTVTLAIESRDDHLLFVVRDTGIGLSAEEKERVFDEFIQADASTTRHFGGTGLGLSLCRKFTEFIGGRIWVESEAGKGSSFFVEMPRVFVGSPPDEEDRPPVTVSQDRSGPVDILVVEDDPDSFELIRRQLEEYDFNLCLAVNGAEAAKAIRERRPGMIFLDVLMPKMNGFEFLRQLKADEETRDIPVVMVSVLEEKKLAFSLGASGYLVKPYAPSDLVAEVRGVLGEEGGKRVVYVEDDEEIRSILADGLKLAQHEVKLCDNLRQGKAALEEQRPDIVILDLSLPDGHGRELLQWMSEKKSLQGTPVVITTGLPLTRRDLDDLREYTVAVLRKQEMHPDEIGAFIRTTLNQGVN